MPVTARSGETVYRGIAVSTGICRGKILVLGRPQTAFPSRELAEAEIPHELERLEQALVLTRHQLHEVQAHVSQATGSVEAGIFEAHMLVLEDPALIDEVTRAIQTQRANAERAVHDVFEKYAAALAAMEDDYLRERVTDMHDVCARVVNNLLGRTEHVDLRRLKEPCIIISHDLAPSTTALLDKKMVLGFGTDIGSKTSHTAIMARSLQIPAVVGLAQASRQLASGQDALLDGFNGVIIINPSDQTLFEYGQLVRNQEDRDAKLRDVLEKPAVTLDGTRILLSANVGQAGDAVAVKGCGAEGVGLFRTEYLFLNRERLPTEEEQYQSYREVAAALRPDPVVIRTMDLGGDKFLAQEEALESNPFLGLRSIRFCLVERDLFRTQLRAILRASVEGNIKLMYPMISGLEELLQANALLEECKAALRAENQPFDEAMEIGAMVEVPSAVLVADALARRVKFLSLGTNDLIQYTLAADRLNEKVAHLYQPTNPAILRLIKMTVEAGHRHGIWVGVCGEMASEPSLVPLLLGLGVDELSAAPPLVPQIKFLVRRLKMPEVRELADFALNCESAAEILARSQALAKQAAPALFENQTP